MKILSGILTILFFGFTASMSLPVLAQLESATSTEVSRASETATTTAATTTITVIEPATTTTVAITPAITAATTTTPAILPVPAPIVTGLPEWGTDTERQSHIWKNATNLIRNEIAGLPAQSIQSLPIPVLFGIAPANLTRNFGDARGSGRSHEGLDMMAPKGTPVVSPAQAVVLGLGTGPDSGNYVYTANPGGETFVYMHLDRAAALAAGNILAPGALIGYVGNTGNAAGGATHLHFEIRKNGATDPYLRLTSEFSPAQKISFLTNIFSATGDKTALAKFLVATYPAQFNAAKNANILLPQDITAEMARISAAGTSGSLWAGLSVGSRGSNVVDLQNFLIGQNKGPAAIKLGNTGATGYFGALTQNALTEYQASGKTAAAPAKMTQSQILARIAQIKALITSLQQQLLALSKA